MAKQIVAWCDVHLAKDEQVVAQPVRVGIDGQLVELDLCEECTKLFVQPVRELLAAHGQPIRPDELTCNQCGKSYAKRDTLRKHLERKHGLGVGAAIASPSSSTAAVLGQPQLDVAVPEAEKLYECPDCDRRFETPQGAGAHRNRAHGYVSPTRHQREAS